MDLVVAISEDDGTSSKQCVFSGPIMGKITESEADHVVTGWPGGPRVLLEDWDLDGYGEIVLGSYSVHQAVVLPGNPVNASVEEAATTVLDSITFGVYGQADDITGDDSVELLVGDNQACAEGRAYLVEFPGEGTFDIQDAASVVYGPKGENDSEEVGWAVVGSVDFDRDGQMDVIMSDDTSYGFDYSGTVYFIPGGGL